MIDGLEPESLDWLEPDEPESLLLVEIVAAGGDPEREDGCQQQPEYLLHACTSSG